MRIASLNSISVPISKATKKGTEIFVYSLLKGLSKKKGVHITAFASGNSKLPVKTESLNYYSTSEDKAIGPEKHEFFANALIGRALKKNSSFDLYHVNMGNGEIVFPYAAFIKKPILVTLHGNLTESYLKKYFALFPHMKNVYFISISNSQRKPLPNINYIKTIYHGVDTKKEFVFNPVGDKSMVWTGRAIPEKGLDEVLQVIKKTKKPAKIFPIIKHEYISWLQEIIIKRRNIINQAISIHTDFDIHRSKLSLHYQTSKLFLFPVMWEEPFGFTMVESMACGTPVIAYAKGSVPEIIKDGITGFIVNQSDKDKRGDWVIKKTGIEGLCEAVERIYKMPENEYKKMRLACRKHVEEKFTVERMVDEYVKVYEELTRK